MTAAQTTETTMQRFDAQRKIFDAETAKFNQCKEAKAKNQEVLAALENELNSKISHSKEEFITKGRELSVDEYMDIRNETTGIKARIEYYQANSEELENAYYNQAEIVRSERKKLINIRKEICTEKADSLMKEIKQKLSEGDVISNLFSYLIHSGKFAYEEQAFDWIISHLKKVIDTNKPLDEHLLVNNPVQNVEFKTPTQKHMESFDTSPKGFNKLIKNL